MSALFNLKEMLDYEPTTGLFRWKIKPNRRIRIGSVAGSKTSWGYLEVEIHGERYRLHRLAWAFVNGKLPTTDIDHINGVRDDNRISNLRLATRSQNNHNKPIQKNNRCGYKGVCKPKHTNKYAAHIKGKYIGYYETQEEAHAAYCAAAHKEFGEYARTA